MKRRTFLALAAAAAFAWPDVTEQRQGGTQAYRLWPDAIGSRLTVNVTVTDRRLWAPLTYRLTYDRPA